MTRPVARIRTSPSPTPSGTAAPTAVVAAGSLVAGYAGACVGSHVLAREMGAWPSVLTVSAAVAAASWVLADRHRP